MTVLIDAHALIWAVDQPNLLSAIAAAAIVDPTNERHISIATAWEIAIKVGHGKLNLSMPFTPWMTKSLNDLNADLLAIDIEHVEAVMRLPHHHGDPFDRLIIAQALIDGMSVISADTQFDSYGVTRIW